MSSSAVKPSPSLAKSVRFDKSMIHVLLTDGRRISAPLSWFPRLKKATDSQRRKWRLIGEGMGLHWEEIDEDISVSRLLDRPC